MASLPPGSSKGSKRGGFDFPDALQEAEKSKSADAFTSFPDVLAEGLVGGFPDVLDSGGREGRQQETRDARRSRQKRSNPPPPPPPPPGAIPHFDPELSSSFSNFDDSGFADHRPPKQSQSATEKSSKHSSSPGKGLRHASPSKVPTGAGFKGGGTPPAPSDNTRARKTGIQKPSQPPPRAPSEERAVRPPSEKSLGDDTTLPTSRSIPRSIVLHSNQDDAPSVMTGTADGSTFPDAPTTAPSATSVPTRSASRRLSPKKSAEGSPSMSKKLIPEPPSKVVVAADSSTRIAKSMGPSVVLPPSAAATPKSSKSIQPPSPATVSSATKQVSASKALVQLLSLPANRSCADCRTPLVDASKVFASFYFPFSPLDAFQPGAPDSAKKPPSSPSKGVGGELNKFNFRSLHNATAPPSNWATVGRSFAPTSNNRHWSQAAHFPSTDLGVQHSAFLCASCASAHRKYLLNSSVDSVVTASTRLKKVMAAKSGSSDAQSVVTSASNSPIAAPTAWTLEEVRALEDGGGNARCRLFLERHMPDRWRRQIPTGAASAEEREIFVRAKYESLAFVLPEGDGPIAEKAWLKLLRLGRYDGKSLRALDDRSMHQGDISGFDVSASQGARSSMTGEVVESELPNRLVDFFCVVGWNKRLDRSFFNCNDKSFDWKTQCTRPEDLAFQTEVLDCYPAAEAHADMKGGLPAHVAKFVFPEGCRPNSRQHAPIFFTFVLTLSSGLKLHGAAMHVYDEAVDIQVLNALVREDSRYGGPMPEWMGGGGMDSAQDDDTEGGGRGDGVVFMPKCLVVLSHYGFFNVWKTFLQQIYRISLVAAPLPIERYIANFVSEVPLPPEGKIEVRFGFTDELRASITRPAENQLPLAGFSYRPLFASLSVGNILTVFGCLLQENRVVLCARNYAILTPVAEALISLLFPLEWQGLYIPVTPASMYDILDAPVPYLVGLNSRYLSHVKPSNRPRGVVFVDLDEDIVHLGYDDSSNELTATTGTLYGRPVPALPDKEAAKLKTSLDEHGGMAYLTPRSRHKCTITAGAEKKLPNTSRELYAYGSVVENYSGVGLRAKILAKTNKMFLEHELLEGIHGFGTEYGTLTSIDAPKSADNSGRGKKKGKAAKEESKDDEPEAENLLDLDEPHRFSSEEIRNSFLRFFVAILRKYEKFIGEAGSKTKFRQEEFVADLKLTTHGKSYMLKVTSSQMFERFIDERITDKNSPEILFFDESIIAKNNKSRTTRLTIGGKKDTPFLSDTTGLVTDTFTPPPPSNWGLPDDGRTYEYSSFPKLQLELFGKVRPPKQWEHYQKRKPRSGKAVQQQQKILSKIITGPSARSMPSFGPVLDSPVKDVEWAIHALAYKDVKPTANSPSAKESRTVPTVTYSVDKGVRVGSRKVKDSSQEETLEVPEEMVLQAQKIILSSRRKKCILLAILVRFQAICRMFLARINYYKLLRAAQLSRQEALLRATLPKRRTAKEIRRIIKIQRIARGWRARVIRKKRAAAMSTMQRLARGWLARFRYNRYRRAVTKLQAGHRQRRVRWAYKSLVRVITHTQARARGWFVRTRVILFRKDRSERFRTQIFELWRHARTPLSYRTRFWTLLDGTTFFSLAMLESEMERLWRDLNIVFSSPTDWRRCTEIAASTTDKMFAFVSACTYAKYLEVERIWRQKKRETEDAEEVLPIFPAEQNAPTRLASGRNSIEKLKESSKRLELERLQVYEKLNKNTDASTVASIYGMFGIDGKEKKKKIGFSEKLWEMYDYVEQSAKAMMTLFPELNATDAVTFSSPSKKGARRFHAKNHASKVPAPMMDKELWVQERIDQRVRHNVTEVTVALMRNMDDDENRGYRGPAARMRIAKRKSTASTDTKSSVRKFEHLLLQRILFKWKNQKKKPKSPVVRKQK